MIRYRKSGQRAVQENGRDKASALDSCGQNRGMFDFRRLLQNPPVAAPTCACQHLHRPVGAATGGFCMFFGCRGGFRARQAARLRLSVRCRAVLGQTPPSPSCRRRLSGTRPPACKGQTSILSICSAAITTSPKARWAATLAGPRTRTCRPPCSSCRWELTRSTPLRSR